MDTVAQGDVWSDLTAPIVDFEGTPITNGEADITVTLFDFNDDDQSSGITVAHVDAGRYRISKTISVSAALGAWGGTVVYDDGVDLVRTQTIDFTVASPVTSLTNAEDVAAAIHATAMGDVTADTFGYYVKSLFTRPVRSGNG